MSLGGACTSFALAGKMLQLLMDLEIATRTINNKTVALGTELKQEQDIQADAHASRDLTAKPNQAEPAVPIACVEVDGGRIQTRTVGLGAGVHDPHWRESKNAGFYRMIGDSFVDDPHPTLPSCFSSRKQMSGLLTGLEKELPEATAPAPKPDFSWRPKSVYRTCLASLCNSDRFGQLMSAEAEQRGFYSAHRAAFLGDGLPYNWTIQQTHFKSFTPILDFIHPIEHLHSLSRSLWDDGDEAWEHCQKWIELCWRGDVIEVIGLLEAEQMARDEISESVPEDDPRRLLAETLGYLRNNASRMDYPAYRREGLPTTSCLIESQVKEMNHRVKGSEKFWNDGESGESILHVRAALISDTNKLSEHIRTRPGSYYTRSSSKNRETAIT